MESGPVSEKKGRVLIVDDNEDVLFAAEILLAQHVTDVKTISDPELLPELLTREQFDVILLDMNFTQDVTSGQEGLAWLARIRALDPGVVVIMITAFADVELSVRAIKAGASDFVVKPWQNEKLLATVSAALSLSRTQHEVRDLRSRQERLSADLDEPFQDFIGTTPEIQQVRAMVAKVAGTDANVLITGENGTGKELVARALHRQSQRADKIFVRVDMGALSHMLFESELFGHVKGAFTDAIKDRPGRFEIASGGTLLLDEIGNLDLGLQGKLLTALQSHQAQRVGSDVTHSFDIRLICATNRSLPDMVATGEFRQDLLYRINTVEIPLPPLRGRIADVPLLAAHFLARYARKYRKPVKALSATALSKLKEYSWPGNVRELQHAMERAVIMSNKSTLAPSDFLFPPPAKGRQKLRLDSFNLEEMEEAVVRNAMKQFGGNISRVAKELGISRPALYRKLERYGL